MAQRKPEEKMQACLDCKLNNCVLVYLRHIRKKKKQNTVNFSLQVLITQGAPERTFYFTERGSFVSGFKRLCYSGLLRSLPICFTDPLVA